MRKRSDSGFAILAVVVVLVVFALLGMAAVSLISSSAYMVVDEIKTQQAFSVAEAGLAYEAEQLENDNNWSDNAGYTKSFNPGSFTVTYVAKTNNTATVRVDGAVGGVTRSIQQAFTRGSGKPKAYSSAMYTETDITVDNNATGDVYGPVAAGGDVDENEGVVFHDLPEENDPNSSVPTPDWAYWQANADHVVTGNFNFTNGAYSGVYYVTGNVTSSNNSVFTLNGTIITRGRIVFGNNSNVTITAASGNPAIFAQSRIVISNNITANITGWIQSQSYIRIENNAGFTAVGGMVAVGDITIRNNAVIDLTYDENQAPGEGYSGGEPGEGGLGESSWEEVF
ncbi:MAG: hypothetical protein WC683_06665 [bacterium]